MAQKVSPELRKEDQATLDHAIGNILDALIFPIYIGKIIWAPILVGIAITILITAFNFDHWWSDILFGISAFIFLIPIVVVVSPMLILHKIKKDLIETVQACVNVSVSIESDTKGNEQDKSGPLYKSKRGVKASLNHVVVPAVCAEVSSRIPIFGRFFSFILRKTTKKFSANNEQFLSADPSNQFPKNKNIKTPKAITKIFNGLIITVAFVTAPIVLFCSLIIYLLLVLFS